MKGEMSGTQEIIGLFHKQTLKWKNGSELSSLVWLNIGLKFINKFKCHIKGEI